MSHMKSINAAFFDLDGTIYGFESHQISDQTKIAINRLKHNRIKVLVASTRPLATIGQIEGIFDLPWDGFITANGQEIWDADRQRLLDLGLSREQLDPIFEISARHSIPVYTGGEGGVFYTMDTPAVQRHKAKYNIPVDLVKPYEHEKQTLITLISDTPIDASLYQHIQGIHLVRSHTYDLDVVKDNVTKARGIDEWMRMQGYPTGNYMAFGDSLSDLEMIEQAAVGVAMEDGEDALKQAADYICPSCQQDGVYVFLKEQGYLK